MGVIFDIKRFAVHDGPGIRTTVFLKGCPLSCRWCHNPESIDPSISSVPKLVRIGEKTFMEYEVVGRGIDTEDLMKELQKELVFMQESGGGVTFSGGEPLLQADFLIEALSACQKANMHTAVDTCGYASWKSLGKVARYTDLFLFDLKLIDRDLHKTYTGVPNKVIQENLLKLLEMGKKVRIRIPLIQGITFTENNMNETIIFLSKLSHPVDGVDLLPYHNRAKHKYERLGIESQFNKLKTINKADLIETKLRFEKAGFDVRIGG